MVGYFVVVSKPNLAHNAKVFGNLKLALGAAKKVLEENGQKMPEGTELPFFVRFPWGNGQAKLRVFEDEIWATSDGSTLGQISSPKGLDGDSFRLIGGQAKP